MTITQDRSAAEIDALTDGDAVARAEGLCKVYGRAMPQVVALDDVTVEFGRGRLTAIMGPSGSGKSTLMHCMAALDTPTSGRVVIDGIDISHLKDKALTKLRRDRLGFVFQAYNLIPTLTAARTSPCPLDIAGAKLDPPGSTPSWTPSGIRDRLTHRPDELSGGQQQRVACARALVQPARRSCSPTSPPATSTPTPARDPGVPAAVGRRLRAEHRDGHPRPGGGVATPTGCCSWPTAGSSTRSCRRPWPRSSPASRTSRSPGRVPEMVRVTLRGLQGHLVRLLLTASAVMLGVSFVTGTFVLRDSIDNTLCGLVASATAGLDVSVRGAEVMAGPSAGHRRAPPRAADPGADLAAVPGAARVIPGPAGHRHPDRRQRRHRGPQRRRPQRWASPSCQGRLRLHLGLRARTHRARTRSRSRAAHWTKASLNVGDRTQAVIGGRAQHGHHHR